RVLGAAYDVGVRILTLYAFSTENWRRPDWEVSALIRLLAESLEAAGDIEELRRYRVCLRASGDVAGLGDAIEAQVHAIEAQTAEHEGITLNLALNYGGRAEVVAAARDLAASVAAGRMTAAEIDEDAVTRRLHTAPLPDPDLMIRTGGEQRISNFLLWQSAYAELYFTPMMWPDFGRDEFYDALRDYQGRIRRFGGLDVG
ncbi:MAG: di-trans,poly-cis-decaprenylcistransferase, partial [Armatimonadetes bacterium]|nr:di-trans,poly-cis-decaprenylcistransferase [Armatimonadota bacterium]